MLEQAKARADESAKRISVLEGKAQSDASQVQKLTADRDTVQSQLDAAKTELEKSNQTATEANAKMTELEKKVTAADADKAKLQTALDQANAEIEQLKTDQHTNPLPTQDGNSLSAPPSP